MSPEPGVWEVGAVGSEKVTRDLMARRWSHLAPLMKPERDLPSWLESTVGPGAAGEPAKLEAGWQMREQRTPEGQGTKDKWDVVRSETIALSQVSSRVRSLH